MPYFVLAQCYGISAAHCEGFAGPATFWAAYDTMAKAVELLPNDSEYREPAKTSMNAFRSRFPTSEECFFNELQEGAIPSTAEILRLPVCRLLCVPR